MITAIGAVCLALVLVPAAWAEEELDFFEMGLDELMNLSIEVTSVSKKEQKMSEAAAAIAVITGEEIRRSGLTSIPEALRMIPGIEVSRIDANRWAITSRGFAEEFAQKLLVMIDGRSVYSPLFGGVYWDIQDTLLEDIDRIEVIRGPGATVWGANAVNGVINIITKHAAKTHGGYASAAGGEKMQFDGGFRWGDQVGEDFHYRVYGKYKRWDEFTAFRGPGMAGDDWHQGRGGFRTDWTPAEGRSFTFQGDYYNGSTNRSADPTTVMLDDSIAINAGGNLDFIRTPASGDTQMSGGNLLGRYSHDFAEAMNATVQAYWDRTKRATSSLSEVRDTVDLDIQHSFGLPANLNVIWGLNYRWTRGEIENPNFTMALVPPTRSDHLATGFLQADWQAIPDKLTLTAGSKFEYNEYTGFEWQPSVRASFTPQEMHTVWASGSRAVHTPTWIDDDLIYTLQTVEGTAFTPPTAVQYLGRRAAADTYAALGSLGEIESEVLYAVEAGYRFNWKEHLSLDLAGYWNRYNRLRVPETGQTLYATSLLPFLPPGSPSSGQAYNVAPLILGNGAHGWTAGLEALASWRVHERVRLSTYYSFIHFDTETYSGETHSAASNSPKHKWHAHAAVDLPLHFQYDTLVWYVGEVEGHDIDAYWRWDMRLGYSPIKQVDLSFIVQNIVEKEHQEFGAQLGSSALIPRTYFGKVTVKF